MKNVMAAIVAMLLSTAAVTAASAQRWIHVRVEGANGGSGNVSFNVPIEMASAVLPAIPGDQQHHGKFNLQASVNGMDLRAMLDAVRNSPDNTFVTYERNDKQVSVGKSGHNLLIGIVQQPTPENHGGETVAIKVPISVVRAMLAGHSDQLDVDAGIRALTREGDVDVTVNREKATVRVWTDTQTTTD
jgi:hypothetical protein